MPHTSWLAYALHPLVLLCTRHSQADLSAQELVPRASAQYDETFDGYDVDVTSYSIYTGDQEDDFIRTEDAE